MGSQARAFRLERQCSWLSEPQGLQIIENRSKKRAFLTNETQHSAPSEASLCAGGFQKETVIKLRKKGKNSALKLKKVTVRGAGRMAQQLRVGTVIAENQGSVPSTPTVACNHL